MVQFNGYYPCSVCLGEGTYNTDFRKVLHPITVEASTRTPQGHLEHVSRSVTRMCFGVKGFSPLENVMTVYNVPFDSVSFVP